MEVVSTVAELRARVSGWKRAGESVGLVPTMGALHAGHMSLATSSRRECDKTVLTIFVNPTQFAPHEDLTRYPRPLERDLDLCQREGVDLVFTPAVEEVYPPGDSTFVEVTGITKNWEGELRPSHFRGVATVVCKLFLMALPDRAYFGQKDFQQQAIIRRMTRDLHLPLEIVTCPIVRDADGLALSSRNVYLSPEDRQAGLCLPRSLKHVEDLWQCGERDPARLTRELRSVLAAEPRMSLNYGVLVDPMTLEEATKPRNELVALVAGRVGQTRLLDNTWLRTSASEHQGGS